MIDKKVPLERVFLRNRLMLGNNKQLPAKVIIKGERKSVPQNDYNMNGVFCEGGSLHEVYCLCLLKNMLFTIGDGEISLEDLLQDSSVDKDSLYSSIVRQMGDFGKFYEALGVQLCKSKKYLGVVGATCYGDFASLGVPIEQFTFDAINIIFGRDIIGSIIDSQMYGIRCPNIIDMLSEESFRDLLDGFRHKEIKFSSLRNYFKCRGMDYLNQEPFIRIGAVCGKVTPSVVRKNLQTFGAVSNRQLLASLQGAPDWDIVILNSKKKEFHFVMQYQLEQMAESGEISTDGEVVSRVGGVTLKYRG